MLTCYVDNVSNKEIVSHTISLIDKQSDSNDTLYESEMSLDKNVVNSLLSLFVILLFDMWSSVCMSSIIYAYEKKNDRRFIFYNSFILDKQTV